jgi:sugar/nucleoside kinase (ribokinase family)
MKYDLCCIGHITKDKVVTPQRTAFMAGGTAFYFSNAIKCFDNIKYILVTAVGEDEKAALDDLIAKGIETRSIESKQSVYFENIYGQNPDDRTQRVLAKATPFTVSAVGNTALDAQIVHLGALLADDFPLETIEALSKSARISVDSQGFLRKVGPHGDVLACDWAEKTKALKNVYYLKANEHELETLTGTKSVERAVRQIYDWGVKEVIATLGASGSVIFDGEKCHLIPAFTPKNALDATGAGDTYMAGFLYGRLTGRTIDEAGAIGAAMATLKIEHFGPFDKEPNEIANCIKTYKKKVTVL